MSFLTEGRRPQRYQFVLPGGVDVVALAADLQLTAKSGNFQKIDPGAARNVDLPGVDEGIVDSDGLFFLITNAANAAEAITVRDPAGATVVTISQNERALVVGTGGATWDHMGIETIALS